MPQTVLVIHSKKLPPLEHSASIKNMKDLRKFLKGADTFIARAVKMFPQIATDEGVSITVKRV